MWEHINDFGICTIGMVESERFMCVCETEDNDNGGNEPYMSS